MGTGGEKKKKHRQWNIEKHIHKRGSKISRFAEAKSLSPATASCYRPQISLSVRMLCALILC